MGYQSTTANWWVALNDFQSKKSKNMIIKDEPGVGYILEVGLEYSKELHYSHNDYPLAPETIRIIEEEMTKLGVVAVVQQSKVFA